LFWNIKPVPARPSKRSLELPAATEIAAPSAAPDLLLEKVALELLASRKVRELLGSPRFCVGKN